MTGALGGCREALLASVSPLLLVIFSVSLGYLRLQVLLLPAASLVLKPLSSGENLSVEAREVEFPRLHRGRVPEGRIPADSAAFVFSLIKHDIASPVVRWQIPRSTAQPLKGSAWGSTSLFLGLRKRHMRDLSLCAHANNELPEGNAGRHVSRPVAPNQP